MIPFLQVQPQSIKLKVKPDFPSLVSASSPIILDKSDGNFLFSLDVTALRASLDPLYVAALSGSFPCLLNAAKIVDFNAGNTDTFIPMPLPVGCARFAMNNVYIEGASGSLSTATMGVFTAPAGGGVAVVAAGSAITVTTGAENTNNNLQSIAIINGGTTTFNVSGLYVRVATPQGVPATAKVNIHYRPVI